MNPSDWVDNYYFWLIAFAVTSTSLEFSRRKDFQPKEYNLQNLFWFVFNGVVFGFILSAILTFVLPGSFYPFEAWLGNRLNFLNVSPFPFWGQVVLLLIVQDFIEWSIHYALHKIPFLWEVHKLHHSIEKMHWLGNFRFHPLEIVVYKSIKYIPLLAIAPGYQVVFVVGMFGLLVGNLNHLSIPFRWRPNFLNYIFNSPGFHIWHHNASKNTVNYAIIFSFWDFLFRTAYAPRSEQPEKIGLIPETRYPQGILARFIYPFLPRGSKA